MANFHIKGKTAVITGASGILCSTLARELAAHGAKIALLDIAPERAGQLAQEINGAGAEAVSFYCDVLNRESIEKAGQAVANRFGGVDILINGAGGNKPAATASPELSFLIFRVTRFPGCST